MLLTISGVLLAVPVLLRPETSKPRYVLLDTGVPVHDLLGISTISGIACLIVLYGATRPKITVFGDVDFSFVVVGTALLTG